MCVKVPGAIKQMYRCATQPPAAAAEQPVTATAACRSTASDVDTATETVAACSSASGNVVVATVPASLCTASDADARDEVLMNTARDDAVCPAAATNTARDATSSVDQTQVCVCDGVCVCVCVCVCVHVS